MPTLSENIDPCFLSSFFTRGDDYMVNVMGELFSVKYALWQKLKYKKSQFNRKHCKVDEWEILDNSGKPNYKIRERLLREKPVPPKIMILQDFDNRLCLELLSGSPHVNFEKFTFKQNGNKTHQIVVNGKPTGCWLDHNNKIGSSSGGGPSVIQWLAFYGHSVKKAYEIAEDLNGSN